jgi:creatinine amidohydrolase
MTRCKLAINLNPSTLAVVITDLVDSLVNHGLRKIVLLNSHGGNDFKPILRELCGKTPAQLFLCNWYQTIADAAKTICEQPEDHAGEWETSIMLAFRSDLVGRDEDGALLADPGQKRSMRFAALNQGWVSITRPWHLLTTNTGSGNPHAATAEKGKRLVECFVERIAPFLIELSIAKVDETFPFEEPC